MKHAYPGVNSPLDLPKKIRKKKVITAVVIMYCTDKEPQVVYRPADPTLPAGMYLSRGGNSSKLFA